MRPSPTQDEVLKRHVEMWLHDPELIGGFSEMRERIRIMNQETSQMASHATTRLCLTFLQLVCLPNHAQPIASTFSAL